MLPSSDSFDDPLDDILFPPDTAAERKLGKFRPKPRLKTVNPNLKSSKPSDAPQLISSVLEPQLHGSSSNCLEEGSILATSEATSLSANSSDLRGAEGYGKQLESLDSQVLASTDGSEEVLLSDQGNSEQEADLFFDMGSLDDCMQPSSTTVRTVGRFQPKSNSRHEDKNLLIPNASPGCVESMYASIPGSSVSAMDAGSSELDVTTIEPVHVPSKAAVHIEASQDKVYVSESDANLQTNPDQSVTEETFGMEFLDDSVSQYGATSEAPSNSRPKLRPKTTKSTMASSDANQISTSSDGKGTEESSDPFTTDSSSIKACSSELHATQEPADQLEASFFNGDDKDASHGDQGKSGEVSDVFFSRNAPDDLHHASSIGVVEALGASNLSSSSSVPIPISSEPNVTQAPLSRTENLLFHQEAGQSGPQESPSDENLENNFGKLQKEASIDLSGVESLDGIFLQPGATAVKQAGKFQPKLASGAKREKKAKSVSFRLPNATETAPTVEPHSEVLVCNSSGGEPSFLDMMDDRFLDQTSHSSSIISNCNVNFEMDDGRSGKEDTAEFLGLESLDNILPQPTSTADRPVGKFRPKLSARTRTVKPTASMNSHGATESVSYQSDSCSLGIESIEDHNLDFPADSLVDSVATWDSNSTPADFAQEQIDHVETSAFDTAPPESNDGMQVSDGTSERGFDVGGKRKLSTVSEDSGNGVQSQYAEELTQEVLDERYVSKTVEDDGASKYSRKLRKRADAGSPAGKLTGGTSEDWDVENSDVSQMDEDHSDDEYRGEDIPKRKRAPKKSKEQMAEKEKPVQRRRKASQEPDSKKQEPPKKKFPHGTRRKRRQVDKVLLETPEYEIDPRQLKIKDLIMLAEAKERIAIKEGVPLQSNYSNSFFSSDNRFDEEDPYAEEEDRNRDGDEAYRNAQLSSIKLNYHTYMNKPQSGRWSKSDTELFYQAIRQFGTDFAMIQQLFPSRTRHQVKLKFKNEERKHPLQVADAIIHRSKDHSHFEKVIQQLQAQAEQNATPDMDGDATTASQDAANGNKEGGVDAEKTGQEANGFEGEAEDSGKYNEWDADAQDASNYAEGSGKYNEWDADAQDASNYGNYEGAFEWDADDF